MPSVDPTSIFEQAIAEHLTVIRSIHAQQPLLERIASEMTAAVQAGKKVLWCGNGGSAATASHFVCDLHAATRGERTLSALSLSDGLPLLTALANDHGYDSVFSEQLAAHARSADVAVVRTLTRKLFTIVPTGRGPNAIVVKAFKVP